MPALSGVCQKRSPAHKGRLSPNLHCLLILESPILVVPAWCHGLAGLWLEVSHIFMREQRHSLHYTVPTACAMNTFCFLRVFLGVNFWIMHPFSKHASCIRGLSLEHWLWIFPLKGVLFWVVMEVNKLLLVNGQMMDPLNLLYLKEEKFLGRELSIILLV